ncbi:MAG: hypothetical protein BroJett021_35200 [Chloroflexota bacterium]|nr:MAG: hypothetical protein BroJett021_35200 [Chloroflexota bacterium]
MKLQATNLVFDGHEWMERLRLPYWTIAKMREMRVGDELPIFEFSGPPMSEKIASTKVACHVQRAKGSWRLEVLWMAHVGKASKRGHIWSWVDFRLGAGSAITLLSEPNKDKSHVLSAEFQVRRICRLVDRLRRMADHAGDWHSMARMEASPGYWRDDIGVVPFLKQIAAPMLGMTA